MTDIRQRLTDALRHQWVPSHVVYGSDEPVGFSSEQEWAEHVADVLLSLPDIAIVELPEPDEGETREWSTDSWYVWLDRGNRVTVSNRAHLTEPRALAAALLAAADAAEREARD